MTATGICDLGVIKSSIVIGRLLSEGIGDTIRVSLTDSSAEEMKVGFYILEALNLHNQKPQIISCPTCGRCQVGLVKIVKELDKKLLSIALGPKSVPALKVAIMGCMVNGPGEAAQADIGIAFGKKDGLLFKKGEPISKVPVRDCISILLKEIRAI